MTDPTKPPPRCGPYSVPVWDAEARRWDRRLTDAGRQLAADYLARFPFPAALARSRFPALARRVLWSRAAGVPLRAIAENLGVSKQRVQQIHSRAMKRLRQAAGVG